MKADFYITTPLYYVNDEPHIGHAYTTILADVIARYHRLFGEKVHLLTGTDEHGQKVADAAAKLKLDPLVHCNRMSGRFLDIWRRLDIRYDDFIRTTEPRHVRVVSDILNRLHENGDIYQKEYEGWYSVSEERFFTEKDLVNGKDPISGRSVEKIREVNYFFRMSRYRDWLIEHYESHPEAVVPAFRLNEVLGFLRQPLGDLCISRPKARVGWGIPIPWDEDYVTYVWFDALLNYYSATVTPPEGTEPVWPADYHLIGKDILTTHAVYWPIMLHAAGIEPPRHILAHGWWLAKDEAKMSKTAGNVIKPLDLATLYGSDAFRYVLMREMVVGQDASFSEKGFVKRVNSDLANDLGNLVNRITKLIAQYFESVVPPQTVGEEQAMVEGAGRTAHEVRKMIERLQIHAAIEEVLQYVRSINRFIASEEPWKTVKTDIERAGGALAVALEGTRIAAVLLAPVMPEKTRLLLERIGVPAVDDPRWSDTDWSDRLSGLKITHGDPIFPRVSLPKGGAEAERKQQETTPKTVTGVKLTRDDEVKDDKQISFEQFKQLDLRTAVVLEVEKVPKTDKLLRLQVDLGSEKRQLVAGVAQHFSPEELVGRTIIVVANLQPAKIRGVESRGMLLAVRDGETLDLLTVPGNVRPGLRIS